MKKLLLVLLVVTLASFLFVGCTPTVPAEGEGEGEGEVGVCPTVTFSDSYTDLDGKTYVKSEVDTTITVAFTTATDLVGVYVGDALKWYPTGVPEWAVEIVMYTTDGGLTYTGTTEFYDTGTPFCDEDYVYVVTGEEVCCPVVCKYPLTVDGDMPYAKVEICVDDCSCEGCELSFASTSATDCGDVTENCGDDCSGLASWSINIYDDFPFDECCDASCETPIDTDSGVCPVALTTDCLTTLVDTVEESVFAVLTLVDNVGNEVKYGVEIGVCDYDTCDEIWIDPYTSGDGIDDGCLDDATGIFSVCEDHECSLPE